MPDPLQHARALIDAHRAGSTPPGAALAWVAEGMALHLHQGVSLPHALGLVRYGGGGGHATVERRRQRDELLRDLHRRYFLDLGPAPAAEAITRALDRQCRARGRVADDMARVLEVLLTLGPPIPAARQLRRVLAINSPF